MVLDEFDKVSTKRFNDRDLKLTKGHIIGNLFSNMEAVTDFARWYGFQESMQDKSISLEEQEKIYKEISSEDVLETACKYFQKDNFYIAATGLADEDKLRELLMEK